MQNKKTIMAIASLMILIFHLWINLTNLRIEMFLKHICVIGVDLFFFVSAYSIAERKTIEYKEFVVNRFNKVYLKFIVFAIIGALYFNWSITKFINVILGAELFTRGGGSFLWFIPGIMLVYLLLPLYKSLDTRYPKIMPFIAIMVYLIESIVVSSYTNYEAIFILTNRIPIILMGYYGAKYDVINYLRKSNLRYYIVAILLTIFGVILSYNTYIRHFNILYFKEIFYILYIPLIIGLILLLDKIKVNKVINIVGSITLELYALQMLFGFKIENQIFKLIAIKFISNILTIIILLIMALVTNKIFNIPQKLKGED